MKVAAAFVSVPVSSFVGWGFPLGPFINYVTTFLGFLAPLSHVCKHLTTVRLELQSQNHGDVNYGKIFDLEA